MTNFQEKNEIPQYWINKAFNLKGSAGIIWLGIEDDIKLTKLGFSKGFDTRIACFDTFIMLFGLSLELLLKGIILSNGGIPPNSHNLKSLSEKAKVKYTRSDIELLNLLSEWIIWSGKYPTPSKLNEYNHFCKITKDYFWEKNGVFYTRKNTINWNQCEYIWKKAYLSLTE